MIVLLKLLQRIVALAMWLSIIALYYYFPEKMENLNENQRMLRPSLIIWISLIIRIEFIIEKKERTIIIKQQEPLKVSIEKEN